MVSALPLSVALHADRLGGSFTKAIVYLLFFFYWRLNLLYRVQHTRANPKAIEPRYRAAAC